MADPPEQPLQLTDEQCALIARALAEPRRYEILVALGRSQCATPCARMQQMQDISPATLSHHMKELENAGLIRIERHGRTADLLLRRDVLHAYLERLARI